MTIDTTCPSASRFDHSFGQEQRNPHERRMIVITLITAFVMVVEIVAGKLTGSMALYGDGIHMGAHVLALGLAALAYTFARRQANNRTFSFGSGKTGDLAGFGSAIILGMSALLLVTEAVERLLNPAPIAYREALLVATVGLIVNGASAWVLMRDGGHVHGARGECGHNGHHHKDNNHRAALLHVAADAVTSAAAIIALLAAWRLGWHRLDPLVALAASVVIAVWAWGLLRETGKVLLDMEAPDTVRHTVINALEQDGDSKVIDLHLWSVAPGIYTLVAAVVTHRALDPEHYRSLLPDHPAIHHPVIEVRSCQSCA